MKHTRLVHLWFPAVLAVAGCGGSQERSSTDSELRGCDARCLAKGGPFTPVRRRPVPRPRFSGTSGSSITSGTVVVSNDVDTTVGPEEQTVVAGESVTFDIDIALNGRSSSTFVFTHLVDGDAWIDITDNVPTITSGGSFQVFVASSVYTPPGRYGVRISGLTNVSEYWSTEPFFVDVVEEGPPPPVSQATAQGSITFSPLTDTTPAYAGTHLSSAANAAGFYDTNGNGLVDGAMGSDSVPFPAFPDTLGNIAAGRAFAQPHAGQGRANVVVSLQSTTNVWAAIHLRVTGGTVEPVQVLVGNFFTGPILIQDVDPFETQIEGALPSASGPGRVTGTIRAIPFFYDGIDANTLWGNTVDIAFEVPLYSM